MSPPRPSPTAPADPSAWQTALLRRARPRAWEFAVWALALASPALLPSHALMVNEIAIVALFALSLDLVLGYTGIVSLGHAAFFGFGAYAAGLVAKLAWPDPVVGLLVATVLCTALGALCSVTVLRGSDLTRLMVTLGTALILLELANRLDWLTGGADGLQGVLMGPLLGRFEFDLTGQVAAWYSLGVACLFFVLLRRLVHSPWGATLMAIRDNRLRAMAIGIPVRARLVQVYALAAGVAGAAGALLAQTTGFVSLDVLAFERSADVLLMLVIGGVGWLYGGIVGAIVFKLLQDSLSSITPQYWMFWIGLLLVLLVLVGRERLLRPWTWFRRAGAQERP
ncbi:branched-chain amino acid ABC transporter permease [Curvibacter sp. RS43]|uniref:branched-chain amino acid ABC transporter permease n=1 Tax=Curvibacter microcysteis TaxID=3026419 RepID=UPI00235F7CAE|nr:branched-chain amino acid ABC transporter permease [Curvibacter sp. RS43]MDD0808722.1 branched-chain amino acid ABC transporter permease [Curvibacter sp. RS43]